MFAMYMISSVIEKKMILITVSKDIIQLKALREEDLERGLNELEEYLKFISGK